jgi:hypothetical protein
VDGHALHDNGPRQQPLGRRGDRGTERRRGRLVGVGDGDQLQVAAAERDDAVVRALPDVAPAPDGLQPVLACEERGRGVEVAGGPEDVVDAACTSGPVRWAICVESTM